MLSKHAPTASDIRDGIVGSVGALVNLSTPFLRGIRSRWGIAEEETQRAHPGDDLVPRPKWMWTHAIEIDAPPAEVWPWVVQLGRDKAGFYSYEWLENLAGCDIQNAESIRPEWQQLAVGDALCLHPRVPPLRVAALEPGRWFVVTSEPEDAAPGMAVETEVQVSWLFFVEPLPGDRCRLISRYRASYPRGLRSQVTYGPWLAESIGFMMDRAMLRGIKRRAERANDT